MSAYQLNAYETVAFSAAFIQSVRPARLTVSARPVTFNSIAWSLRGAVDLLSPRQAVWAMMRARLASRRRAERGSSAHVIS